MRGSEHVIVQIMPALDVVERCVSTLSMPYRNSTHQIINSAWRADLNQELEGGPGTGAAALITSGSQTIRSYLDTVCTRHPYRLTDHAQTASTPMALIWTMVQGTSRTGSEIASTRC